MKRSIVIFILVCAAGYIVGSLTSGIWVYPFASHQTVTHCQMEYGHNPGQSNHWAKVCE